MRQVARGGGGGGGGNRSFRLVAQRRFPMKLSARSLREQLGFARSQAALVADAPLRKALLASAARLQAAANALGTHARSHTYGILFQRAR